MLVEENLPTVQIVKTSFKPLDLKDENTILFLAMHCVEHKFTTHATHIKSHGFMFQIRSINSIGLCYSINRQQIKKTHMEPII